ncbi:MAG: hypothetical protein GX593_04430, partial [Actinomycetales bacterium]|nr:hypothetical protein [Actinomycetales bacterium]
MALRPARALLAAAVLLASSGCASGEGQGPTTAPHPTVTHHGLFVEYGSVAELEGAADAVLVGEVLSATPELVELAPPEYAGTDPEANPTLGAPEPGDPDYEAAEPDEFVYTVYEVAVVEGVEGRFAAGDRVQVRLVGGLWDGVLHEWHGVTHPDVGETYAFFVSDVEAGDGAEAVEALNPTQSMFRELSDGDFEPLSR